MLQTWIIIFIFIKKYPTYPTNLKILYNKGIFNQNVYFYLNYR